MWIGCMRGKNSFVEKTFVWGDAPFSIRTMLRVRFIICDKRIVASIRSIYSRHNRISCKYTFISYCDMIFLPVYPSWHVYFVDFNKKMADKRRMPKRSIAHLIRPYGSSAMDVLFSKSWIEKARVFFSIYQLMDDHSGDMVRTTSSYKSCTWFGVNSFDMMLTCNYCMVTELCVCYSHDKLSVKTFFTLVSPAAKAADSRSWSCRSQMNLI
jgi:hypothetical protein